jgi:hypothetical protein
MKYLIEKFNSGMHYIIIEDTVIQQFSSRVLCKINDDISLHCAFMPKKEGGFFINIGSTILNKLKLKEGDKISVVFSEDNSEHQFDMSEEFEEVLATDPEANNIFQSLTKGNQRGLIYVVSQVKSSEKKIERALKVTEKLKNGITNPRLVLK